MAESPLYRQLAMSAASWGCDLSAAQIHSWVRKRLLPPLARRRSLGRHGFRSELRPEAIGQLRALCRLRSYTKRLDPLRLLLWIEGWPVPLGDVKAALRRQLPQPPAGRIDDDLLDQLSGQALRKAVGFRRALGRTGLTKLEAAEAGEYVAARLLGERPEPSESLKSILDRALGLDRARRDAFDTARPWLEQPPDVSAMFDGLSLSELYDLASTVSTEELDRARSRAAFLVWEFPRMIELLEILGGRNFGGLHSASRLGPRDAGLAVLIAVRSHRQGLSPNFDELVAGLQTDEMASAMSLLPEARRFVAEHPQRRRLQREGLLGHLSESQRDVPS